MSSQNSFINSLIKSARLTFLDHLKTCTYSTKQNLPNQNYQDCVKQLALLQKHMDDFKAEHISYKPPYVIQKNMPKQNSTQTFQRNLKHKFLNSKNANLLKPIGYISVYEDEIISVSVFSLPPYSCLPLHNHPKMHGAIKVIYGSVNIECFSPITCVSSNSESSHNRNSNECFAQLDCEDYINETNGSILLTPLLHNIHKISTNEYPGAFIDILSPPYNKAYDRDCHYFKIIEEVIKENNNFNSCLKTPSNLQKNHIYKLKEIEAPSYYWCATYPYIGPVINIG